MNIKELSAHLNQLLNIQSYADLVPNGIQVMNIGQIQNVATAVSADLATIEQAINRKANVLITHHGIFKNNETTTLQDSKYLKIKKLLEHNIGLLTYHLPLDAHQTVGNNWKAAQDLGWQNLQPFGEYSGKAIGVRGNFHSIDSYQFKKQLENYYSNNAVVVIVKQTVSSAALISGAADKSIMQAVHAGVDCFITGNVDEPVWYTAHEEHINFYGLGHAATEKVGPKALAQYLQTELGLSAFFIDTKNPF